MTTADTTTPAPPPFMLTIDLEPDWGVAGHQAVRQCLPRFCTLLDRLAMPATFFVTAELIDRCGSLLKRELGRFEIASHGMKHQRLTGLTPQEQRHELTASKRALEDFFGRPVTGFRAPFLARPAGWFGLLAEAGYRYDSSLGSVAPSPRNLGRANWRPELHGAVAELPVATLTNGLLPFNLTWLRLLHPFGERLADHNAAMFFLHLHELADPLLAKALPPLLRPLLGRNAGEPAWAILERLLPQFAGRATTCSAVAGRLQEQEVSHAA